MSEEKSLIEAMDDIYYVWDFVSKEKARMMLEKLLLADKFKNIEEKRLVLHNLTTIIMQIRKDQNSAKHYSKVLVDMLDNCPNYKDTQINRERYCKAKNNYTVCYLDELSKEELVDIYTFYYETYKGYDDTNEEKYMEKLIAGFNLHLTQGNYDQVLIIVEDLILHTTNKQYEEILQNFIDSTKDIYEELYNKIILLLKYLHAEIV